MAEDLISIIIPIYNVERYLDECIQSVINQTYKKLEIILVNDGSTDNSLEVCEKYRKDSRVILINKQNEGLSKARQSGIDILKGKYFCTIDSDDFINSRFVEKLYNQINRTKSDICVCARIDFKPNFSRVIPLHIDETYIKQIEKNNIENSYKDYLDKFVMSDSWNKIYRTDFVKASKVKFTLDNKYNGTDLLFNHLILLHCPKITALNLPLYNHRILESSRVFRKNKQMQKGFMIILDAVTDEIQTKEYDENVKQQLEELFIRFHKIAAEDLYFESSDRKILKLKFEEFINVYKSYKQKHDISLDNMHFGISSKLFVILLDRNFIGGIILYFDVLSLLKTIYKPIKNFRYRIR